MQEAGLARLDRLPASRREAESIAALASAGASFTALDFRASRATALSSEVSRARIVHFASHGLLNSRHPELSGIVLSLVDEQGRALDGFFQTRDIYKLRLSADLVVLSACQTALGKEVRGEGLIGLSRGFMYAGTPRIVASLWRVPDRATAEFMAEFYRGVLRQGLTPAAALRAAQRRFRGEKLWSNPYYWAAFTLQGEWE
jgi:CHAT domain-containing protein